MGGEGKSPKGNLLGFGRTDDSDPLGIPRKGVGEASDRLESSLGHSGSRTSALARVDELSDDAVFDVDVAQLVDNPYNSRNTYDSADYASVIEQMAGSLDSVGQLSPILVTPLTDELREVVVANGVSLPADAKFVLIDGGTRVRAVKVSAAKESAGRSPTLRACVKIGLLPRDLFELAYFSNEQRHSHNDIDRAIAWKRVLDSGVYESQTALANACDVSVGLVSGALAYWVLPEEVRSHARRHPSLFSTTVMGEVRSLMGQAGADKAIDLATLIVEHKYSQSAVKAAKSRILREQAASLAGSQMTGFGMSLSNGPLKIKASEKKAGRIEVTMDGLDDAKRKMLESFLKELAST